MNGKVVTALVFVIEIAVMVLLIAVGWSFPAGIVFTFALAHGIQRFSQRHPKPEEPRMINHWMNDG